MRWQTDKEAKILRFWFNLSFRFDANLPASCVVGCPNRSTRIPLFRRHHVVERSCWTAGPRRPCPGTAQQISTESRKIFKSSSILNLIGTCSMVKTFEMIEMWPSKQFGTALLHPLRSNKTRHRDWGMSKGLEFNHDTIGRIQKAPQLCVDKTGTNIHTHVERKLDKMSRASKR